MYKRISYTLLLLLVFFSTPSSVAQTTPPNPNPPPPGLPIDGFIWFGILVALALGIYVFMKEERLKRSPNISTKNHKTCTERRRSTISQLQTTNNNPKK